MHPGSSGSGGGFYPSDEVIPADDGLRSPAITLPATGTLTASWKWYLAHGSNATSADLLRVSVVHGGGTTVPATIAGAASLVEAGVDDVLVTQAS